MRCALAVSAMLIAAAAPVAAGAHTAYIASGGSLLAGPGASYPQVADVSGGEPVQVYGCIAGYAWCDVSFQGYRGWFDGRLLTYPYGGIRVALVAMGGEVAIPVESFSLQDYWDRFYRDRSFYRDRARWIALQSSGAAPDRVHGPAREHGAPSGPHLPPTPTLQPRPHTRQSDTDGAQTQPR
jgi:uncharacterized protein YraI